MDNKNVKKNAPVALEEKALESIAGGAGQSMESIYAEITKDAYEKYVASAYESHAASNKAVESVKDILQNLYSAEDPISKNI